MTAMRWMRQFGEAAGRLPVASLLLGGLAVLAYVPGPQSLAALLQYDRAAVGQGEWYRLLTCHWTHWSLSHLAWDVLALVVLAGLCEMRNRRMMLACIAAAGIAIPLAVAAWLPEMIHYRGLSGLDSALFGLLAVQMLHDSLASRQRLATAAVAGVVIAFSCKVAIELATGGAVFVQDGQMVPVPLAHVVGAATGGLTYALMRGEQMNGATAKTRTHRRGSIRRLRHGTVAMALLGGLLMAAVMGVRTAKPMVRSMVDGLSETEDSIVSAWLNAR